MDTIEVDKLVAAGVKTISPLDIQLAPNQYILVTIDKDNWDDALETDVKEFGQQVFGTDRIIFLHESVQLNIKEINDIIEILENKKKEIEQNGETL